MTLHNTTPHDDGLRFSAYMGDGYTIAVLSGELDVACSPVLREQLLSVLRPRATRLVIDLSEVTFCDASGLAVLVGTGRRAALLGGVMRLAAPAPVVVTALHISGLLGQFDIFPTVLAATAQPHPAGPGDEASTHAYTGSDADSAEPAAQTALMAAADASAAGDLREAVASLLVHAEAWRDCDPSRRFTSPLRALARAHAGDDHTALAKAACSLMAALARYPLTYSPAVAATASDLRHLIGPSSGVPVPA
ncbi:MAG TPA: STAS domain-containing protein [Streptosporangiaceae bacterium]|nr:STAS domain-containing protein [Streptosporangiaceae bacterium]